MSPSELAKVKSRLHLPEQVIKFIQKRYSALLLGENMNMTRSSNATKCTKGGEDEVNEREKEEETECEVEEVDMNHQIGKQSIDLIETTELTVVKEVYVDDAKQLVNNSNNNSNNNNNDNQQQVQQQRNSNNEIMKVDEETLYIVEKRRRVQNGTPVEEVVDTEIRKNFELKPKEIEINCVNTTTSTTNTNNTITSNNNESNSINNANNNCNNNGDCGNPSKVVIVPAPLVHEVYSKKVVIPTSPQSAVKKMIDDLKVSIMDFNKFIQLQQQQQQQTQQSQQIQTEINDYQLHFFKVCLLYNKSSIYRKVITVI